MSNVTVEHPSGDFSGGILKLKPGFISLSHDEDI